MNRDLELIIMDGVKAVASIPIPANQEDVVDRDFDDLFFSLLKEAGVDPDKLTGPVELNPDRPLKNQPLIDCLYYSCWASLFCGHKFRGCPGVVIRPWDAYAAPSDPYSVEKGTSKAEAAPRRVSEEEAPAPSAEEAPRRMGAKDKRGGLSRTEYRRLKKGGADNG